MAPEGKSNLGMLIVNTPSNCWAGDQHVKQVTLLVCLILKACCGREAQNNIQHDRYLLNFDQTIQNRCHFLTIGH